MSPGRFVRRTRTAGFENSREFSVEWGDQSRVRALAVWFVTVETASAGYSVGSLGPDFSAVSALQVFYDTHDGVGMELPVVGHLPRVDHGTPAPVDGMTLLGDDEIINGIYGHHGAGRINSIGLITQHGRRELHGARAGTPYELVLEEMDPVRMRDALITGLFGFEDDGGIRGVGLRCRVSGVGSVALPWGPGGRIIPVRDVGKTPALDMQRVPAAPKETESGDQSSVVGPPAPPAARPNPNHQRVDVRRVEQWDDVLRVHALDGTVDEFVFVERIVDRTSRRWIEIYASDVGRLKVHIGASEPWIEMPNGEAFAAPAIPPPAASDGPTWDNVFSLDHRVDYLAWATRGLDISKLAPFDFQASSGVLQQEVFRAPAPGSSDFHIATTGKATVVPNGWLFAGDVSGTTGSRTTSASTDEESRQAWSTALGFSADAEALGAKLAFSSNTKASQSLSSGSSNSLHSTISETVETDHVLVVDLATVELADGFAAAVIDTSADPSPARIRDFVERFGSHFPYAVTFGSKTWEQSHETEESINNALEQGSGQKISGSVGAEGISGGFESDRDSQRSRATTNARGAAISSQGSIGSAAEPVPVLLEVRELTELLSPIFFDDPFIHDQLRRAVHDYLVQKSRDVSPWEDNAAVRIDPDDEDDDASPAPTGDDRPAQPPVVPSALATALNRTPVPLIIDGKIHVFWRDENASLYDTNHNDRNWVTVKLPGSERVASAPAPAIGMAPRRVDVFWRAEDGTLWDTYSGNFSESTAMTTGRLSSESLHSMPAPLTGVTPNRCDVFWVAADGTLWATRTTPNSPQWAARQVSSERLTSPPAPAIGIETGRVDVFWRAEDGTLWDTYTGNFTDGATMTSGQLSTKEMATFAPAPLTGFAPGRCDVFWVAADGTLWSTTTTPNSPQWADRQLSTRKLTSAPAPMTGFANGRIDVFWRAEDGSLWDTMWYENSWTDYQLSADRMASAPMPLTGFSSGRADVFWKAENGQLKDTWWNGRNWLVAELT